MTEKLNVVHVITGLDTGGAEMMLLKLVSSLRDSCASSVISLRPNGALVGEFEARGIPVYSVGLEGRVPTVRGFFRLLRIVKSLRPEVVHGWMYHGNFAAWLAQKFSVRRAALFWNVRQTLYEIKKERFFTELVIRVGAFLSRFPYRIVYNSEVAIDHHEKLGYAKEKSVFIPNGIDCRVFRSSEEWRRESREALGLQNDAFVIGHVARFHPMKDHATLFSAASLLFSEYPDVHFVLIGRGLERSNPEIEKLISMYGLGENMHLCGEEGTIERYMNAFDVFTLTSAWGEGFPNVVGEAMACKLACVVTDVGDVSSIVGEAGIVVPPGSEKRLAEMWAACLKMSQAERSEIGRKARERIEEVYSLDRISEKYEKLYSEARE